MNGESETGVAANYRWMGWLYDKAVILQDMKRFTGRQVV